METHAITYNGIPTIVLDFPWDGELMLRQGLANNPLPGLLRVDGPKRSLGNTSALPRSTISMSFTPYTISDIELRIFSKTLREEPLLSDCLIGTQQLFGD